MLTVILIFLALSIIVGKFWVEYMINMDMSKMLMSDDLREDWESKTPNQQTLVACLTAGILLTPVFGLVVLYGMFMF